MSNNIANRRSVQIALTAIIASLYAVLTVFLAPLSYGMVQIRFAEVLAPLPFLLGPIGVVALIAGCFVANAFSPYGILDMVLGTMGTVTGSLLAWKAPRLEIAVFMPVITNAIWVGLLLQIYGIPFLEGAFFVGIGQIIASVILGYPTMLAVNRAFPYLMKDFERVKPD